MRRLRLLSFATLLLTGCVASPYSTQPYQYSGVRTYQTFCASCHGLTGHGDGPVQPFVHNVPDLTQISARHDGRFPAEDVRRIIDGRTRIDAHGDRRMPVWGWEFYGNDYSDAVNRERAARTIDRLVKYLETIQLDYDK